MQIIKEISTFNYENQVKAKDTILNEISIKIKNNFLLTKFDKDNEKEKVFQIYDNITNNTSNLNTTNLYYKGKHNNTRTIIQSYFAKKRKIYITNISILEKRKVYIQFSYYSKKRKINYVNYKQELLELTKIIQEIYGKKVVLIVSRTRYSFINAQIFAINLSKNLFNFRRIRKAAIRSEKLSKSNFIIFENKNKQTKIITQKNNKISFLWKKIKMINYSIIAKSIIRAKLPFIIKGIKIQLHGRLLKERFKRRKTQKTFIYGNLQNSTSTFVDQGFYTQSNRKGSFTIKIWIYTNDQSILLLKSRFIFIKKVYLIN